MEEKKLTADDILKAMEKVRTEPFGEEDRRVVVRYYDLCVVIDRLKDEIEKLKSELKKELAEHEEFTKKAKEEIERLTIAEKQYLSEIERLNKSCGLFDIKLQEQIKETYDYVHKADKLKKRNTELEKQLNVLKLDLENWKKAAYGYKHAEEQAVKDTAKEIYSEINSCIEKGQEYCGLDWRGLLTAKTLILVYCKKKGVEVE